MGQLKHTFQAWLISSWLNFQRSDPSRICEPLQKHFLLRLPLQDQASFFVCLINFAAKPVWTHHNASLNFNEWRITGLASLWMITFENCSNVLIGIFQKVVLPWWHLWDWYCVISSTEMKKKKSVLRCHIFGRVWYIYVQLGWFSSVRLWHDNFREENRFVTPAFDFYPLALSCLFLL